MKLYSSTQIKKWDDFTIKNQPITSAELMENTASLVAKRIGELLKQKGAVQVKVFCGSGNNGGDGYVVARKLMQQGFLVSVYTIVTTHRTTIDNERNYFRLMHEYNHSMHKISGVADLPALGENDLVVDAIFGIGAKLPVESLQAAVIKHINAAKSFVVSVDVPSGFPVDIEAIGNMLHEDIIQADLTLTFQIPKQTFLLSEAYPYTGDFEVIDIGLLDDFVNDEATNVWYVTPDFVHNKLKTRYKYSNKGNYGHLLLAAGSDGKIGAAVLSARGSLAAGCGLVTAAIPKIGYIVLQTAVPEAMVVAKYGIDYFTSFPETTGYSAVAVGPGLGTEAETSEALISWLGQLQQPCVIDADALNIISKHIQQGKSFKFPAHTIITPHPREFDRLVGASNHNIERIHKQIAFAKHYQVTLLLKGAHTCIVTPDGRVYFNSTGNPVLATAGSGDVLTGIIGSFLAQGYSTDDAAILGAYYHGACADEWVKNGNYTMLAGQIPNLLHRVLF